MNVNFNYRLKEFPVMIIGNKVDLVEENRA